MSFIAFDCTVRCMHSEGKTKRTKWMIWTIQTGKKKEERQTLEAINNQALLLQMRIFFWWWPCYKKFTDIKPMRWFSRTPNTVNPVFWAHHFGIKQFDLFNLFIFQHILHQMVISRVYSAVNKCRRWYLPSLIFA